MSCICTSFLCTNEAFQTRLSQTEAGVAKAKTNALKRGRPRLPRDENNQIICKDKKTRKVN